MTSDGISKGDWDGIHSLALSIVNANQDELMESIYKQHLLDALTDLEQKYGRLPSILATKADYSDDPTESMLLLREAYEKAVKIADIKNQFSISASLAELSLESGDCREGLRWAGIAENILFQSPDAHEEASLQEVKRRLRQRLKEG